ncbi:11152_t:CDS:1, partial [Scutellospora calospora]
KITEIRKKYSEIEIENVKLKQVIEEKDLYMKLRDIELNNRIIELEWFVKKYAENARQSQTKNSKLKDTVANLEQEFKKYELQLLACSLLLPISKLEKHESTSQIENQNLTITLQKNINILQSSICLKLLVISQLKSSSQLSISNIKIHIDKEIDTDSIS